MNKKFLRVLTTLMLISCLFFGMTTLNAYAVSDTVVSIDPSAKTVDPGETFTLNVKVVPGVALAGAQCDLSFNPEALEVISITEGDLFKQGEITTYFQPATINNTLGTAKGIAVAITTPGGEVSGEGVFITVNLKAKDLTSTLSTDITLSNVIVGNKEGKAQPVALQNGQVTVNIPVSGPTLREQVEAAIDGAALHVIDNNFSSHWVAVGLARAGKEVPADYLQNTEQDIIAKNGDYGNSYTEYEKMTIGILAAGGKPTNIGGYNLIEKIYNGQLQKQGINAFVFGLIALDAGEYQIPADATWNRDQLIQSILDKECINTGKDYGKGGWAFSGTNGDPDMTGMAMTALAPYYNDDYPEVQAAVNRAVNFLSATQKDDGGFASWGTVNSESCSQAIMGLCANGIDPTGDQFTKANGNLIEAALRFKKENGGFSHIATGNATGMTTEQALYSLAQYIYYLDDKGSIYWWGDQNEPVVEEGINVKVRVESYNQTIVPETELEVAFFDLTPYHGSASITETKPIHAIIRALETKGIDCTDKTQFDCGGGNYISNVAGIKTFSTGDTDGWQFYVNNAWANRGVGDYDISDGDSIVLYFMEDYSSVAYSYFNTTTKNCEIGEEVELTLTSSIYDMMTDQTTIGVVHGAKVLVNNEPLVINNEDVLTDEDGKIKLTFDTPGTYFISAERIREREMKDWMGNVTGTKVLNDISRPYCKVVVEGSPIVEEATVTIGSINAAPGSEVSVPISIENITELAGGEFTLTFDPEVAVPVLVEKGALLDGFTIEYNLETADTGSIRIAFASDTGIDGSGVLFNVTFQIKGAINENTAVVVNDLMLNDMEAQELDCDTEDGAIAVGVVYGDLNGDGEVTAADATLVLRNVVGLVDFNQSQIATADVSDDGKVTAADATLILRYIVELINEFPVEK